MLVAALTRLLFLQVGALSVCCSNICELYLNVATETEIHRKKQSDIDGAAADSLWDYSEEYRLQREDLEAAYEAACTALRESADYDSLQANFEAVLRSLQEIEDSYRAYHERSCYLADMHLVNLTTEFKGHLEKICGIFTLSPIPPHPILHNQNRIVTTAKRLNQKFFPDEAPVSSASNDGDGGKEDQASGDRPSTEDVKVAAAKLPAFKGGVYTSPLYENPEEVVTNAAVIGTSSTKIGGKYGIEVPVPDFVVTLFEDASTREDREKRADAIRAADEADNAARQKAADSLEPPPQAAPTAVSPRADPAAGKKAGKPSAAELAAQKAAAEAAEAARQAELASRPRVLPEFPWLSEQAKNALREPPLPPPAVYSSLDSQERAELEDLIAEFFVYPAGLEKNPVIAGSEEKRSLYARCLEARQAARLRALKSADPEFILAHVPADSRGKDWLERIEVYQEGVVKILTSIRNSLVTHLENEAYYKTVTMEELNKARKTALTEELEDRLRTHWPRRGRVETQLKQPREAELLSHEEKTWRIIQSIQEKMLGVQTSFNESLQAGFDAASRYARDMDELMTTLKTASYKTLASLQVRLMICVVPAGPVASYCLCVPLCAGRGREGAAVVSHLPGRLRHAPRQAEQSRRRRRARSGGQRPGLQEAVPAAAEGPRRRPLQRLLGGRDQPHSAPGGRTGAGNLRARRGVARGRLQSEAVSR